MGNSHTKRSPEVNADVIAGRPTLTSEEVPLLPLVPHSVYAALAEHVYNDPNRRELPPGWKILVTCAEVNLDREGFYAVAYINEKLRHCIISHRGTSDVLGLRAGVWVYFDEPTIQVSLAEQFSKHVRLHLTITRRDASDFIISYTGHSLGAVLAACRACEEQTFAITFESPGCKVFIEKTMHPFKAEDVDIITYLRPPNPINTLRPQCGYLVQIPVDAKSVGGMPSSRLPPERLAKLRLPVIPSPQEYLRRNLVAGIPQLQQYVNNVEPVLREMMEQTQQVHSIQSIATHFGTHDEGSGEHVILVWPSHLMQFLEYYNITKALEDPQNQLPHVSTAYESLQNRLCTTVERPRNKIPLRFLNKDSQKLVRIWWKLDTKQLVSLPLSQMDHKVLNTTSIEGESLCSSVLTAFQAKQYLNLIVVRPEVLFFLNGMEVEMASKL